MSIEQKDGKTQKTRGASWTNPAVWTKNFNKICLTDWVIFHVLTLLNYVDWVVPGWAISSILNDSADVNNFRYVEIVTLCWMIFISITLNDF